MLEDSLVEELIRGCWMCLNQYKPNICPFFKISERDALDRVVELARNCSYRRMPQTDEEKLKVL